MMYITNTMITKYAAPVVCLILLLAWNCGARQAKHYTELVYPKLHDMPAQEVQQVTLANGLRLFLLEDHELPLVEMFALLRVGSRYESADKVGLASILGEVMRTGGTTSQSGDQVDVLLDQNAVSLDIRIGFDSSHIVVSATRGGENTALDILAEMLMHPAFPRDRIHLAKLKHRNLIAKHNDDPVSIATRELGAMIYGADSIYTRQPEAETIDGITRDDLLAFHRRFIGSNSVMLGVWGDFDSSQMVDRVRRAFADWRPVAVDEPARPEIRRVGSSSVCLVSKPDVDQSTILLGHIGGVMHDGDYAALVVMNKILGGGFTGRLFRNVRSREGLTYSVFGEYSCGYDCPGLFYVGCRTKSSTTVQAIRAMLKEIEHLTTSGVTDEELAFAKESYRDAFVFEFDAQGQIIRRRMTYEYYGCPADFLEKTRVGVEKVTKQEVLHAAQKHVHTDQIQIVVVGCPDDFDEPLSAFGRVTVRATEGRPNQ